MRLKNKLNELIENKTIQSYKIENMDGNGNVGKEGDMRNSEVLFIKFNNGETLNVYTFCSGSSQNTCFDLLDDNV
jgi:hypothetical protein